MNVTMTKVINTIVISEHPELTEKLRETLQDTDYRIVFEGKSLQELLTLKLDLEPELLIAIMDTSDTQVMNKFKVINEQFPLPIVIFTHDGRDEAIEQAIEAGISAYIVDGFRKDRVPAIIRTAMVRFRQTQDIQKQLKELRTSLADRKVINKAKGLIMQQRQCSEEEAYQLLRTSAMNQNIRLVKLARNILDAADLLGKG